MNEAMTVIRIDADKLGAAFVRATQAFGDFAVAGVSGFGARFKPEPTPARACTVSRRDSEGKWRPILIFPRQPLDRMA